MKKWFALLAVVCLLMTSVFAYAEEETVFVERTVLQNELAPELVIQDDDAAASIYDASGNLVDTVSDDGSLQLVDVYQRYTIEDQDVATRLTSAYEGLMGDVHFSDVGAIAHDDVLKIDINDALMDLDLTAHDLIMFELFDAMLYGEKAALLADGAYMEFTVKLEAEQTQPTLIIFTPDGNEWEILQNYSVEENNITIRLERMGTIAFLMQREGSFELGDGYMLGYADENTFSTLQENPNYNPFSPSVSGKPGPTVVAFEDESGSSFVGTIEFADGRPGIPVREGSYLIITPVSECDYKVDIMTHEHLEWAYDDVLTASSLAELQDGIGTEIDAYLAAQGTDITCDDMVIRDLFEVTVYGDYVDYFYMEGAYLQATFNAGLTAGEPLVVLFSSDSVNWKLMPAENITLNADGTVTLRMEELGVVAFMVEKPEPIVEEEEPVNSPE